MFDVMIMLVSGIIGYIMVKNNYPIAPIALALILGPILEEAIQLSLTMTQGNILLIFTRPLTIVFFVLTIISLFWPLITKMFKKVRPSNQKSA